MKVLFDVKHPFAWAHGGVQIFAEKLMAALAARGVEVEPLRWYDASQKGNVLLLFYPANNVTRYAKQKGLRIVDYIFLDGFTSHTRLGLAYIRTVIRAGRRFFPYFAGELGWNMADIADAFVFASDGERRLGEELFGVPLARSHAIVSGVDDVYFEGAPPHDGDFLLSVGTIHERKNTLLLARLAKAVEVPVVFVGKPYSTDDAYFRAFLKEVDNRWVIYKGGVDEKEKLALLQKCRGFALLSRAESGCISVLEAQAARCPVFLPDFLWARFVYGPTAVYGRMGDKKELGRQLKSFYERPPAVPAGRALRWPEIAEKFHNVLLGVQRGS